MITGRTKPGIPIVEVCQKAFMNVYAITEKRVRIQRERLIVQAQEFAASNGESPLQPMDSLSLLAQRTAPNKLSPRGGENFYQQKQDPVAPRINSYGTSNLSITPFRVSSAHMPHPRDLMNKLGDRDITMVPAHANGSLSILPVKRDSFPFKNNTKVNRDISMISLGKQEEPLEDDPTDLSMPTDLSVRKRSMPQDLSKLNIPSATTIVPVHSTGGNQPVDLSVKNVRPKMHDEIDMHQYRKFIPQYPIAKKYKQDKPSKQEYESEVEMDGDEMDEMDMEPGTEAGMDGDMAMEQAYEPEIESELESRPGATPDSLSSHSVHADDRHEAYSAMPAALPFLFQPNGNDIALVNSFFLNQLWQPEFIDTELLRQYHMKREELKEKKKQQRKVSRTKVAPEEVTSNEEQESKKVTEEKKEMQEDEAAETENVTKRVEEGDDSNENEKENEETQEMADEMDDAEGDEEEYNVGKDEPSSEPSEMPEVSPEEV